MKYGLSDQVRSVAEREHVHPAIRAGNLRFSIAVRDLMKILQPTGFPAKNWPQICSAIQTEKFLRANGLEIESVEGPPSKQSPTVVIRYRVVSPKEQDRPPAPEATIEGPETSPETPEEWAHRMTGKLFGLMREEIAAFGGGDAFLRWVRGYDEEDEAA
jgi:hypothetical protein